MYHIKDGRLLVEFDAADPAEEAPAMAGALITLLQSLFAYERPALEVEEREAVISALSILKALQSSCKSEVA